MSPGGTTAAVGLSGGVDSSVAAHLLIEQGYCVVGITMKIYDPSVASLPAIRDACFGPHEEKDIEAARNICRVLGIPFYSIDLTQEYRSIVLEYFRREYLRGRTPNPCIVCNRRIKFELLIEKAWQSGISFDYFATGHYARIDKLGGRFALRKAVDLQKDQTYFLYTLSQEQLSRTLFPLGHLTKSQVRKLARTIGLPSADRAESQDFIGDGNYQLLFRGQEIVPGEIVDERGHVLGRHKGLIFYTVGQRKGLGIAAREPLYVIRIEPEKNRIVVGPQSRLFSRRMLVSKVNFMSIDSLQGPMEATAKIRYKHDGASATLQPHNKEEVLVTFHSPQRAITPGQSAVFYSGDYVVGGGVIMSVLED